MKILCREKVSEEEIVRKLMPLIDLEGFISKLVEKKNLILERRERSFKPLMGIVMKEFHGKVDGRIVAEKLKKTI